MANFFRGDDVSFDALIYGSGNRTADNFLQRLSSSFHNTVHEAAMPMFNSLVGTVFESVSVSKGLDSLRALGQKLNNVLNPNQVSILSTPMEMQLANAAMRRWVMACPEIRAAYSEGLIVGYDDLYENHHSEDAGNNHYDYRRVTNGIYMERPDGYGRYQYWEDVPDEDVLTFADQVDILVTWDNMKAHLFKGDVDPTSPYES